jgi:hypothetical protein
MPTEQKTTTLVAGYRVTSGAPLNLKKFLRGDSYALGLNEDLDIIDARLTSDTALLASQEAVVDGQATSVLGRLSNLLVNGGFDFWQRGAAISGTGVFTADQWKMGSTFSGTVSRALHLSMTLAADDAFVGPFSALVSSSVTTAVVLRQRIFSVGPLAGQTFQFSASVVTSNAGRWRLGIKDLLSTDYTLSAFAAGTGAEQRLSVTHTLAAEQTWVEVALLGTISAPATHKAVVGDASLCVGSNPDAVFIPGSPLADLYRCMRQYFKPGNVLYLPIADFGFQPKMAKPFQLPMQHSGTPTIQNPTMVVGSESVPADFVTASAAHVVLGTYGGSATADPDEALRMTGLSLTTDAF